MNRVEGREERGESQRLQGSLRSRRSTRPQVWERQAIGRELLTLVMDILSREAKRDNYSLNKHM
jgi:hypothetical protein